MECKVRNLSINYEITGAGKPIIILHGYTVDHRLMSGCMEPIFNSQDEYRRIYMDLPGMGKTKSADWIVNSDVMLDTVIEFIEKVIPDENFLLAGESYGGYLARGIVQRIGKRVDGLFLLCPAINMNSEKRDFPTHIVLKRDDELLSQLEPTDAKGFDSIQVVQSKRIWERYRDEILAGIKLGESEFLHSFSEKGYWFSFDVDALNEKFYKPTLMLLGRQDSIVGYKDAWRILDNYPRATFAVLDRAGHNLQIEQEELFNSLVREWLLRVKEA
ncbi:MAG: alpha/beta hydrolase [Clostridia bacterium]|nr:alpha/beta hydrolase [Clostridia bacterium]